jgi:hypothetical protein
VPAAEHAPRPAGRVDDADQHAKDRRLAGAIGTEKAVNRSRGDGEADSVHGPRFAEILDEVHRFDGDPLIDPFVSRPDQGLSKRWFS